MSTARSKKWKIGFAIAVLFGLLSAGASLVDGMHWRVFMAVLCASMTTHLSAYLMKHPVEEAVDDDVPPVGKVAEPEV